MSRTIIITEDKAEKLSGMVGDMLTIGGRMMSCLEELKRGSEMGERMGMRDNMPMGERGYNGIVYGDRVGMPMGERGYTGVVYGDRGGMPMDERTMGMRDAMGNRGWDGYGDRGGYGERGRRM